jgi:hypothetical protein
VARSALEVEFGQAIGMQAMLLLSTFGVLCVGIGGIITVLALRHAPEGVETNEGFAFVAPERNRTSERNDPIGIPEFQS